MPALKVKASGEAVHVNRKSARSDSVAGVLATGMQGGTEGTRLPPLWDTTCEKKTKCDE